GGGGGIPAGGGFGAARQADHDLGHTYRGCRNRDGRAGLHDEIDADHRCEGRQEFARSRVTVRRRRTRPNSWHSSQTPISTTITAVSTDDPLLSILTAPLGTLQLVFGGAANGAITLASALAPKAPAPSYAPSKPQPLSAASYEPVDQRAETAAHPQRIELSIDSLPNYLLIEPIPVIIDPVGDAAYTAWLRNLDTNATGQS